MPVSRKRIITTALAVGLAVAVGLSLAPGFKSGGKGKGPKLAAPVEVAAVRRGPIELRRTFSGTLEAVAEFVVAPKIEGRVLHLGVDIGDTVTRGQLVAELDNREDAQNVIEAEADLAVAHATFLEAKSALEIAEREYRRVEKLSVTGVVSASQHDAARAEWVAKQAQLAVADARVSKAEAALGSARVRLSYTKITAEWGKGSETRVIADRFVDEGVTVEENTPLLTVVELDPIVAVVLVTEKEYAHMAVDQRVVVDADAYPGQVFEGRISRIAPVFKSTTRQARVEVAIPNADGRLKPGMFVRATVVMDSASDAVLVPEQALTKRGGGQGLFVLSEDGATVHWREVKVGIRAGETVQILEPELSGRVVTLGQQFITDGGPVTVAETAPAPAAPAASGKAQP